MDYGTYNYIMDRSHYNYGNLVILVYNSNSYGLWYANNYSYWGLLSTIHSMYYIYNVRPPR